MLTVIVGGTEYYDEETETFETVDEIVLQFEHSLLSLSKWESKYQKPFLDSKEKTSAEIIDYIILMLVTPNVEADVIMLLDQSDLDRINSYIESKESATTFGELPERRGIGETITAELIYYWLVAFNIPFEVQSWHLNRLLALVRICNIKQSKPKKMSKSELASRNRSLNAQRRAALGTSG